MAKAQEQLKIEEEARLVAEEETRLAEIRQKLEEEQARLAELERQRKETERIQAEEEAARLALAEEQRLVEEAAAAEEEQKRIHEAATIAKALQQQQDKIAAMLDIAEGHLTALRLTTPAGHNALETYQQVLDTGPQNQQAIKGLERIVAAYLRLAKNSVNVGKSDQAAQYLETAESVLPGSASIRNAKAWLSTVRDAERVETQAIEAPAQAPETLTESVAVIEESETAPASSSVLQLAVFPFASRDICAFESDEKLLEFSHRLIERSAAELRFSALTTSSISAKSVWTGAMTKKPEVPAVLDIGQSRGLDAVLMAWVACHSDNSNPNKFTIDIYLIDIGSAEVHHTRVMSGQENAATESLLETFIGLK